MSTITRPTPREEIGAALQWAALAAWVVACMVPLALGLAAGWAVERAATYAVLALLALALVIAPGVRVLCHVADIPWIYLLVCGLVGLGMQFISGDPFLQPIFFTIPLVHAALRYGFPRTAGTGMLYLGFVALGLWWSGQREPVALLFPVAAYGALGLLIGAFVGVSLRQAEARAHADRLAADLAHERDILARLARVTGTLTRDLDLVTVLEQVAAEGCALTGARSAGVWLRETREDSTPALRLVAAVGESGGRVAPPLDDDPAPVRVLAGGAVLLATLAFKGATIGVIEFGERPDAPFDARDMRLIEPFAAAAAVAIENARLYARAQEIATLAERNRLARELHDTIAQELTATTMQLEAAQRAFDRDPARARQRLARAHDLARAALANVRRSVWALAEPLVDGAGLPAALAEQARQLALRSGIAAECRHSGPPPPLDAVAATHVARIVQEALHNIEKHARASQVSVVSCTSDDYFQVAVRDNGVGFVPDAGNAVAGYGLSGMHERARLAQGSLQITSAPGAGTMIALVVPVRFDVAAAPDALH